MGSCFTNSFQSVRWKDLHGWLHNNMKVLTTECLKMIDMANFMLCSFLTTIKNSTKPCGWEVRLDPSTVTHPLRPGH